MRHLITACALLLIGLAAAIPFWQSSPEKSSPSAQIASGPLGNQLESEAVLNVSQWIDRSESDPAIAWQSQPMSFQRDAHAMELPPMPDEFSFDEVDKAIPQPIQSRFSAAVTQQQPVRSAAQAIEPEPTNLQAPPFAGEPIDALPSVSHLRNHELNVQGVSAAPVAVQRTVMRPPLVSSMDDLPSTQAAPEPSAPTRHYIREPN